MIRVEPERFEDMVADALDSLPDALGRLMRNVAVTVEHGPGPPGLPTCPMHSPTEDPNPEPTTSWNIWG